MQQRRTKKYIIFLILTVVSIGIVAGCTNSSGSSLGDNGVISGMVYLNSAELSVQKVVQDANDDQYYFNNASTPTKQLNENLFLVKFNDHLSVKEIESILDRYHLRAWQRLTSTNIYGIEITSQTDIDQLATKKEVVFYEPDYSIASQVIANDSFYPQQWNLDLIQAEKIWRDYAELADDEIVVAVLDSGIFPNHPDLNEILLPGRDFIDDDYDPTDTSTTFSHGTHVAGIIAAITNNRQGIAGINAGIRILPVRVIGSSGTGGYSALIAGIDWAVEQGADIINFSLAGNFDSNTLHSTIQAAYEQGVTLIAAAGNDSSPSVLYPAYYDEVIAVGAVGPEKELAPYSNYGDGLTLVAPGGNSQATTHNINTILSTSGMRSSDGSIQPNYHWAQGTSMAAPHVSGLAAYLYQAGITNPTEIKDLMVATARDLGQPGFDFDYGAGLIDIYQALQTAYRDPVEDNDKQSKEITELIIYAVKPDNQITNSSIAVRPDENGYFQLNLPAGDYQLKAWQDNTDDQLINSGDYYAESELITLQKGEQIENVALYLETIN